MLDVATGQAVANVEKEFGNRTALLMTWFLPEPNATPWFLPGGGYHPHTRPPVESLSHDGKMHAMVNKRNQLTLAQIEAEKCVTVTTGTSRWFEALLFVCGFVAWAMYWGNVVRHTRRRLETPQARTSIVAGSCEAQASAPLDPCPATEAPLAIEFARVLMILSGTYIILRTVGALFQCPAGWPLGLPFLVIGLYSVTCGASRDTRRLNRVAVLQLLCFVSCDFLVGTSACILFLLANAHRLKRSPPRGESES
jgi:hypothetical protein